MSEERVDEVNPHQTLDLMAALKNALHPGESWCVNGCGERLEKCTCPTRSPAGGARE